MIKIYVVTKSDYTAKEYTKWITFPFELVDSPEESNLLLFTGGTDVNPSLYGEDRHPNTESSDLSRDIFERAIFDMYGGKIPSVGICRGSQFLTVMNGGKLVQDVNGHTGGGHRIEDIKTGKLYKDASGHHQMMYPYFLKEGEDFIMIAEGFSTSAYEFNGIPKGGKLAYAAREAEIVFYPKTRSLAIQGHPEWAVGSEYTKYCNQLLNEYLFNNEL